MHHLLCSQWLPVLPSLMPFVYHSASQLMCFSRQQLSLSVSLSQASTHYCHINASHLLCAPPSDKTLPPPTAAPPRVCKPYRSLQICANLPIPPLLTCAQRLYTPTSAFYPHHLHPRVNSPTTQVPPQAHAASPCMPAPVASHFPPNTVLFYFPFPLQPFLLT